MWLLDLLFEFVDQDVARVWMGLDEAGDVAEMLDSLALPAAGIAPGPDLALQRILKTGDAEQDAVHVCRPGPAGC